MQKFICLLILALLTGITLAEASPKMAVASNMSLPMTDITLSFRQQTNINVKLSFGSSGNFARQIIQGAPFRLFLSADSKYVQMLAKNNVNLVADIDYARGRIGILIPRGSPMFANTDLDSTMKTLIHGNYKRLVIANPEHAPYGLAAEQALQSAGLWVIEKKRLLLAENAAQATQIALSGNVDAGIIPASFTHLPALQGKGKFFLIPERWHQPLQQHLVLLEGANGAEKQFFEFLQTETAYKIIRKYGYFIKSSGD